MSSIKRNIFKIILLTIAWLILRESISVFDILLGVSISAICVWYSKKYIPFKNVTGVHIFKLALYFFYLVGQIYIAGFYVIKMTLFGANAHFYTTKTKIKNELLRVIFADSITLTPGSILIDLTDDNLTVAWLLSKKGLPPPEDADELLKGNLENLLLNAQKE